MTQRRIISVLLLALLGNSGLACACSLVSPDSPNHAHHGMSDPHANVEPATVADCEPACGGHGTTALSGKTTLFPDFTAEKTSVPALHFEHAVPGFVARRTLTRLHANQRSRPPASTPASRRDIQRD